MIEFKQKVSVITTLKHQNLASVVKIFEDNTKLSIVSEYLEGQNLLTYITKNHSIIDENFIRKVAVKILEVLKICHESNVSHRSINPSNIIFSNDKIEEMKIINLATNFFMTEKMEVIKSEIFHSYFLAPENTKSDNLELKCELKSDIWGLGVILYIMATGVPPFNENSNELLETRIQSGKFDDQNKRLLTFSKEFRALISKMLVVDIKKRTSAKDALTNAWFTKGDIQPPRFTAELKEEYELSLDKLHVILIL